METFFMPYLLPLVLLLLPLSLYLICFIRKNGSGDPKNPPPGSEGWPILGEIVELCLLGFQQFVRDRMQKHSPVIFKTSLMREKMAVLCGAQGNKFVFTNDNKHLFTQCSPASLRKVLFPDLDDNTPLQEAVASFHSFHHRALKPEALKQYVPVMDNLARDHLRDGWRPNTTVKALPLTKKFTFDLAFGVFMNVVDSERLGKLLEPFSRMTNGLVSVPVNLPGTAFNRAIRAGKVVRGELMRMVRERRKEMMVSGSEGWDDMLSKMAVATDEDGVYMSDDKVLNVLVSLLLGAQYQISSAITVVVHFLAQLPHIYDEVLKEQMEIAKMKGRDKVLTWEDVEKMKYTWNVVCECFRLVPPGPGGFREVVTEFTYAGFTIPKGWKIYWTGHSSHMNPNYFPEPEKFDPSRFEGSGPAPYTYIPFGGGPKMCPGRAYVKLVILVFVHNLVTSFRLEKLIPNEKILFDRVSPAPAHDLPLRLYPHQN